MVIRPGLVLNVLTVQSVPSGTTMCQIKACTLHIWLHITPAELCLLEEFGLKQRHGYHSVIVSYFCLCYAQKPGATWGPAVSKAVCRCVVDTILLSLVVPLWALYLCFESFVQKRSHNPLVSCCTVCACVLLCWIWITWMYWHVLFVFISSIKFIFVPMWASPCFALMFFSERFY